MQTKWMFPDPADDKSICLCGNRNMVGDWIVWPSGQVALYFVCSCGWTRIDRVSSEDQK